MQQYDLFTPRTNLVESTLEEQVEASIDESSIAAYVGEDSQQLRLLEVEEDWRREWRAMPEFDQQDRGPYKTIYVHFETPEAVESFSRLVG